MCSRHVPPWSRRWRPILAVCEEGLRRARGLLSGQEPSRWSRFQRLWSEVAELIEQRLTIKAIYEGLVEHADWRGGYDMFRRYVRKMTRGAQRLERAAAVVRLVVHEFGRATVHACQFPSMR